MLMNEDGIQHGLPWTGQDPAGWYLSEKFNGCRAYWDGREMWTRGGLKVSLPSSWRAALPVDVHLDGEIYDGIGGVYRCGAALRYGRFTPSMRFMVFDAPGIDGAWPDRMQRAAEIIGGKAVARCVPFRICTGLDDALRELRRVRSRGGEDIMLRAPGLMYSPGQTERLLKLRY